MTFSCVLVLMIYKISKCFVLLINTRFYFKTMLIFPVKLVSVINSHLVNVQKHLVIQILLLCMCVREEGQGGWNSQGCETRPISAIKTSCFCNHLTNFAVLLVSHKMVKEVFLFEV
jgi:hypothetical protein